MVSILLSRIGMNIFRHRRTAKKPGVVLRRSLPRGYQSAVQKRAREDFSTLKDKHAMDSLSQYTPEQIQAAREAAAPYFQLAVQGFAQGAIWQALAVMVVGYAVQNRHLGAPPPDKSHQSDPSTTHET